ncbi:sugar kinase [Cytobacillus praedii]|uniref:sugar kinase n=1 Tax=Cytobacillus praedii TaxID=1742358 RepID=UPI003AF759BD
MNKKIAAFGEVMMRLEVPNHELLAQANTLNYSFSGTGTNITAALARLGYSSYLVSTLPNNPIGDAAISYIHKLGISSQFINRAGNYIGMYFLENGFGWRPSRVTYSNRRESSFNTAADELYEFGHIAKIMDIVHFCGITLAMNDSVRKQMLTFASHVKRNGGTVVFDCNYRPALWGKNGYKDAKSHYEEILHLADVVMMNEKDAMFILDMKTEKIKREDQLTELIPNIYNKYNIPLIAGTQRTIKQDHTHSIRGFVYKNNTMTFSNTHTFPVLDRIGSGDAFTSGIIYGICEGFSIEMTVDFATAACMLAHTIKGDTPMSTKMDIIKAMTYAASDVER